MKEEYRLFVEKAYKLENSPFWQWLVTKRGQPNMERIISGDWLAHDGLSPEALDSFCLTLRLLIQNGDGLSVREIGDSAKSWPDKFRAEASGIEKARRVLNAALDEESIVSISPRQRITNRRIFDVIFYGGIVHSNPTKRKDYERFVRSGLFSFFAYQAFISALMHYRNCIQTIAFHLVNYARKCGG